MSAPAVDRLELGPPPRAPRREVRRRVVRAALAWCGTSLVLLVASVATARGWQPPPTGPPLAVGPLPSVAPVDRHLPYAFVDRSETVTTAGARARVVRPRGAEGTIPGVVIVAGAGATTRDDLAAEAEALARGGLAVLTYDKRTEGYSPLSRDYGRLADDALAALDTVARLPGVDPRRVGMLGFSEGGWVVPLAAEREPGRVAFTVLVSAPVVSPLDQALWVVDRRLSGSPRFLRAAASDTLVSGRPLLRYLDADVRPALAASRQPTYAVWGAADATVPVAVAVDRVQEATRGRGAVEVVPGSGHRVPVATGWAERASDWVRRGYPDDPTVRGVQPETLAGLPTAPTPGPFADPRLHLVVATLVALAAAAWPRRRRA